MISAMRQALSNSTPSGCGCWGGVGPDQKHWWDARHWPILMALLMAVPLLWPSIPPLTDLPGHIGRFKVQLDLANSPALQGFYGFDWKLIGNLGLDLLIIPVSAIFGLELGVKLIVIAIPVLTAAGMVWTAHEVHGRVPPTLWFALPLALGHPFTFGFVNFALSMALALNALALWLRLGRMGKIGLRAALFVPIGFIIWITHSFGWGVLGLLVFAAETVRYQKRGSGLVRAGFNAAVQCLSLFPPALLMVLWRSDGVAGGTGDWFNWGIKLHWIVMVLRDRWMGFDVMSVAVVIVFLIWAIRARAMVFSHELAAGALLLLAVYIVLPRILLGSAYADMRLAPYMIAIAIMAAAPSPAASRRMLMIIACTAFAFFGARLTATTISFALHHQRHTAALEAIDHIPKGARVAAFVGASCGTKWHTQRLDHIPALAIVRREAFSNDQWALAGAQLLSIKKKDAPGFVQDPSQFVTDDACKRPDWRSLNRALADLPRESFDYIWLLDPPKFDAARTADHQRVWTNGADALYAVRPK
jgi:hypothetical protein